MKSAGINDAHVLQCGPKQLVLDKPCVMGILNITPDSFSDGGQYIDVDIALKQAESMINAGADIIDVGGESTRPGAESVSDQAEMDRVLPIIEAVNSRFDTIISLDSSKALTNGICTPSVLAICETARTSLGRQDPPKAKPGFR